MLGEGKTLVATLPCYLNALRRSSGGVHVITVNDYLSARDAEWMGKLYNFLGLSCRAVQSGMTGEQYKHAFSADIVYVTGQELGFTYLRDNTAQLEQELVGKGWGEGMGGGEEGRGRGEGTCLALILCMRRIRSWDSPTYATTWRSWSRSW